jgi:hypothetical protein
VAGTAACFCETTAIVSVQELEEDPELRQHVALYKDLVAVADAANTMDISDDGDDAHELEVPLEELLDDLEGLDVQDE